MTRDSVCWASAALGEAENANNTQKDSESSHVATVPSGAFGDMTTAVNSMKTAARYGACNDNVTVV